MASPHRLLQKQKKPTRQQIKKTLKDVFGFDELRDAQADVIDSVLAGAPTLAIMPTGAGKSLCYQLPTALRNGVTIVVSPLIALMRDQREKLDALEMHASELNSTISSREQKEVMSTLGSERTEVIYVTPERFVQPEFLQKAASLPLNLFVIDEAHCLSQWGHDFRPAYIAVADAWKSIGSPQLLALTATATADVIDELKQIFSLPQLRVVHSGVYRDNLFYETVHVENDEQKLSELLARLEKLPGNGIIYSATVQAVEEIHHALELAGIESAKYHGRMPVKDRNASQTAFMSGEKRLMVATNAFGMGIDKSNIRFIIHYHFDGSLEAYYQESGRAGRDGDAATCTLLYLKRDKRTQSFFLAGKYPKPEEINAIYCVLSASQKPLSLKTLQEILPKIAKSKVKVIVAALQHAGLVGAEKKSGFRLVNAAAKPDAFDSVFAEYQAKKMKDQNKLKAIIMYAQSARCRWKIFLDYFGQNSDWHACGNCDNCKAHGGVDVADTINVEGLSHSPSSSFMSCRV